MALGKDRHADKRDEELKSPKVEHCKRTGAKQFQVFVMGVEEREKFGGSV